MVIGSIVGPDVTMTTTQIGMTLVAAWPLNSNMVVAQTPEISMTLNDNRTHGHQRWLSHY